MRIILINPPQTVLTGRPSVPYNILTLGTYLDNLGHDVKLVDFLVNENVDINKRYRNKKQINLSDRFWKKNVLQLEAFETVLRSFQPDLIGISIGLTESYYHSQVIIKKCKEILSDVPIVVGGNHATFSINEIFSQNDVDIVVKNDGRKPLELILNLIKNNELKHNNLKKIFNIAYKYDGKIIETEFNYSYLLNYFPNNYDLLPIDHYYESIILLSLICPYKCPFCSAGRYYNPNYKPPIDNILEEIEHLTSLDIDVGFGDNTFTLNKKLVNELFEKIKQRGLNFKWRTTTRIDQINRELLLKMKEAGCTGLLFGLETLHDDILKIINKRITYQQIKKAVKLTKEMGIDVISSFIIGLPFQTPDHLIDQINRMEELDIINKNLTMGWLVPFKGTEFYNNPEKYQLKIITNNYYFYSFRFPVVETPYLPFEKAVETFQIISFQLAEKIDPSFANLYKGYSFLGYFLDQLKGWKKWWVRKGWDLPAYDDLYLLKLEKEIQKYT
ncbi:MAG: B12-binding domain-containing radical SAM protein [Candidatus Helarchaeota archaeon]